MKQFKKIHFLLIYPLNTAPGQRFRFEQYFPLLDHSDVNYSLHCFYDEKTYGIVVNKGGKFLLSLRLLLCLIRQLWHLMFLSKYDCIMIQRGAMPFGPPISEWIVKFLYRKPMIYDFDDAIWHSPTEVKSSFMRWLKSHNKIGTICKWADTVVVGNEYLGDYARQFNNNVFVIPTVVNNDSEGIVTIPANPKVVVGWSGSHSTLMYVEALEDVLLRLKKKCDFDVMIMANKPPKFKELQHTWVQWSEKAELEELPKIDVGIMPLPDDEWTKGKCGLKAIQYMAISKPAVVSGVGVNPEIVDHGVSGFVCYNDDDWEKYLEELILDRNMIAEMGKAAFIKVDQFYSLKKGASMWSDVLGCNS